MWIKIDDSFADHPKILRVGPLGAAIQIRALCYCARFLTDGFIPESVVKSLLGGMEYIGIETGSVMGEGSGKPIVTMGEDAVDMDWPAIMVDAGLWHEEPGGFRIHDYLVYNPSREKTLEERARVAERVKRFREKKSGRFERNDVTEKGGNGNTVTNQGAPGNAVSNRPSASNDVTKTNGNAVGNARPVPVPVPVVVTEGTGSSATIAPSPEVGSAGSATAAPPTPPGARPEPAEPGKFLGQDFSLAEIAEQEGIKLDPPNPGRYVPPPPDEIEARRARTKAQLEAAMTPEEREEAARIRAAGSGDKR